MTNKRENQDANASRPNFFQAWFLASRPWSLAASAIPVVVALSLAWSDLSSSDESFRPIPAICCFFFAVFAQIAANFINDYSDFKKGADGADRVGPARGVGSGWITPRAMLVATFLSLAVACCFGLGTLPYGGWKLIAVGLVSCVFCLLYSAGPVPLAYVGLGDVLVVSFFGFVAVGFTYYLQTNAITLNAVLVGLAVGFAVDNILVSNNYRDRDGDRVHRKYTLVVLLGERFGRYFYLANGLIVVLLLTIVFWRRGDLLNVLSLVALLFYLVLHWKTWRLLVKIRSGSALVRVLELSSRNVLVLGVLLAFALAA